MLFDTDNELRPYLANGERLVWIGRPKTGLMLKPADAFMIPFSLIWGGFAIFWVATAWAMGAPFFFVMFGFPFVLVGLYLMIGRFFWDARKRARTVYGLTPNRILIFTNTLKPQLSSHPLQHISEISFTQKNDGSGTIVLGAGGAGPGWVRQGNSKWAPQLEMIEDVMQVYEKILSLQKSAAQSQQH